MCDAAVISTCSILFLRLLRTITSKSSHIHGWLTVRAARIKEVR